MTAPDEFRYPAGRFDGQPANTAADRVAAIDVLRVLPEHLSDAVVGLSRAQLDTPYRDGGWTVRQVVHHVADSHMNAYVRIKLALTENWPTIRPYDQAAWAGLADSTLPVDISLSLIDALHARWVVLLESLAEADFARGYFHPENGRQPLSIVLPLYAWHARHHTAHITSLRARRGW
jgi:hypothetical protein